MHYNIERINPENFDIIESNRRAGNIPGLAQAMNLARRLHGQFPSDTVLISAVHGKDKEDQIIAVANPYESMELDEEVIRIDQKKLNKAQKAVKAEIQSIMEGGVGFEDAKALVLSQLESIEIG